MFYNNENTPEQKTATLLFLVFMFLIAATILGNNLAKAQAVQCHEPKNLCVPAVLVKANQTTCTPLWHAQQQDTVYKMQHAVLTRLTLYVDRNDNPVYAGTCAIDRFGCEARIRTIVEFVAQESTIRHLDPWIVLSMIWHESRFNPYAVSRLETRGVMQLHPRNRRFSSNRFLHRQYHRTACRNKVGNCQDEVIQDGTQLLRDSIDMCDGSLEQGLTMYNSGRCTMAGNAYVENIFEFHSEFVRTLDQ